MCVVHVKIVQVVMKMMFVQLCTLVVFFLCAELHYFVYLEFCAVVLSCHQQLRVFFMTQAANFVESILTFGTMTSLPCSRCRRRRRRRRGIFFLDSPAQFCIGSKKGSSSSSSLFASSFLSISPFV